MMFMGPMVPATVRSMENDGMENILRPLIVVGGSVVITLVVGWLVDLLLRRADGGTPTLRCGGCCDAAGYRSS